MLTNKKTRSSQGRKSRRDRGAGRQMRVEKLEARLLLFKPYTHIAIGSDVLDDVQDGAVQIEGTSYALDARVASALKNQPAFYNAGVVGPDGFPDLVMGQGVVHPVNTGRWLKHVLDSAWEAQADSSPYPPIEVHPGMSWVR